MSKPAALAALAMLIATARLSQPSGDARKNRDKAAHPVDRGPGQDTHDHKRMIPELDPKTDRNGTGHFHTCRSTQHPRVRPGKVETLDRQGRGTAGTPGSKYWQTKSVMLVTFETDRKCRVETGRWYGAFTGVYEEVPDIVDIDHLVPLKNAHNSGGWAWPPSKKWSTATTWMTLTT